MHRKPVFALAAVFLVIALVVPPALLIFQADKDFNSYSSARNNPGIETAGNATAAIYQMHGDLNKTFTEILVIEPVFVILFAVTVWFGIKHTHPEH